jgi:hypothetical protein
LCFRKEGISRLLVNRAVDERRRRAAREQLVDEKARRVLRDGGIAEAALGRERVRVEPRQQPRRRRRDHVRLREVDVRIDETGDDQLVAHLDHLRSGRELRRNARMRARRDDMSVFDDQKPVFVEDGRVGRLRRIAVERQQLRAISRLSHE